MRRSTSSSASISAATSRWINPTITTGLSFGMSFDDSVARRRPGVDFGAFTGPITFDGVNVTLDLGFLSKIVTDIQEITKPLQPIINVLNAQIPGLDAIGIKETLVGLFLDLTGNSDEKARGHRLFQRHHH